MTATDTGNALLAAILEHPEDDVVRLVYADFLEEDGQAERAEFIRVQIGLERLPLCLHIGDGRRRHILAGTCQRCAMGQREHELYMRMPSSLGVECRAAVLYHRGFVYHVGVSLADWLTHGPAIVLANPVEDVLLIDREPHVIYDGRADWFNEEEEGSMPEGVSDANALPDGIWRLLPQGAPNWATSGVKRYTSAKEARRALSVAALAWAKAQPV